MALYLSPLVDINEVDLTTTISSVATSIGVLAIRDPYKGPELKAQLITTIDELIDVYGEPTSGSYKDIMAATGFLKYGNKLYTIAAFATSASYGGMHSDFTSGNTCSSYTAGPPGDDKGAYILSEFESQDPDKFGEESVVFGEHRQDEWSDIAFIAKTRGKWGNFIKVAYCGSYIYNAVRAGLKTYTQLGISSDMYNDLASIDLSFDTATTTEFIVLVKVANQDQIDKTSPTYTLREAWLVSTNDRKIDDEGANIFCENFINANSKYIRVALKAASQNTDMTELWSDDYEPFGGGLNRGATITDIEIEDAYDVYEDPETIDINLLIDADKSTIIKTHLISIAEDRKDTMAILDVPQSLVVNNKGNETTDMRNFRLGTHGTYNLNSNTSYAALYGNWLEVYDRWNDRYRWVPSSGHVAGIYANTDDVSDPWFAPAGLNRGIINNVRKLGYNPNQAKRDILYKNGINPIASFAGQGKVVWGQKTMLDKNSAFNRVNVRRLFIILEKSIATAVKYFLFEPNDSFTRLQLINMIDPFLRDVKSRRGIYDYLLVADSTNNTPERIDRNELWVDIYIKPTKAAEFIVLNFIATKTGASFQELIAAA